MSTVTFSGLLHNAHLSGEIFCRPFKAYDNSKYVKAAVGAFGDPDESVSAFAIHFFPFLALISLAGVGVAIKKWVALPQIVRHNEEQKRHVEAIRTGMAKPEGISYTERTPEEKGIDPDYHRFCDEYSSFEILQEIYESGCSHVNTWIVTRCTLASKRVSLIGRGSCNNKGEPLHKDDPLYGKQTVVDVATLPDSPSFIDNLYDSPDLPGEALTSPLKWFNTSDYMQRCNEFFDNTCKNTTAMREVVWRIAEFCLHLIPYLALSTLAAVGCAIKLTGIPALQRHNEALKLSVAACPKNSKWDYDKIDVDHKLRRIDFATVCLKKVRG